MGAPLTVTLVQVRVDFKENWGGAEPKQCCNVMVEAPPLHRLHPTSMSYAYTVFQNHDMLWMGIGVPLHCYVCAGQRQGWILGKLS